MWGRLRIFTRRFVAVPLALAASVLGWNSNVMRSGHRLVTGAVIDARDRRWPARLIGST